MCQVGGYLTCLSLQRCGSRVLHEAYGVFLQQPSLPGIDSEKCSNALGRIPMEKQPQSRRERLDPNFCTSLWP